MSPQSHGDTEKILSPWLCGQIRDMIAKLTIRDLDLQGNRVFIRVDFNVPIKNGKVQDDLRILESLPTIRHALVRGAVVILASHLGRPKGKPDPEYSLAPVP